VVTLPFGLFWVVSKQCSAELNVYVWALGPHHYADKRRATDMPKRLEC
jgi:hypothetical protein